MDAPVIRERYKVTQVLWAQENYAALQAVDIQDRETRDCLMNVYEGALLKPFLTCYSQLRHCPDFQGLFVEDGSLAAVFQSRAGMDIDQVFYKGAKLEWADRLHYAQLLMHQALSMADYPPEVACAGMLSENLFIQPDEKTLLVHYVVRPLPAANQRELIFLTVDQVKKVLAPRFYRLDLEKDYVQELSTGGETSVVALYARWTQLRVELEQGYTQLYERMLFSRAMRQLWANIRYSLKKTFRGKKG